MTVLILHIFLLHFNFKTLMNVWRGLPMTAMPMPHASTWTGPTPVLATSCLLVTASIVQVHDSYQTKTHNHDALLRWPKFFKWCLIFLVLFLEFCHLEGMCYGFASIKHQVSQDLSLPCKVWFLQWLFLKSENFRGIFWLPKQQKGSNVLMIFWMCRFVCRNTLWSAEAENVQ